MAATLQGGNRPPAHGELEVWPIQSGAGPGDAHSSRAESPGNGHRDGQEGVTISSDT